MRIYVGVDKDRRILLLQVRYSPDHFDSREWQYRAPNSIEAWKTGKKHYTELLIDEADYEGPKSYVGHMLKEFPHRRLRLSRDKLTNVSSSLVKEVLAE